MHSLSLYVFLCRPPVPHTKDKETSLYAGYQFCTVPGQRPPEALLYKLERILFKLVQMFTIHISVQLETEASVQAEK